MAIDINRCILEGRLGSDPEEKILTSGTKTVRARIACSDDYQDRHQQWQQRTYWITIQAFGHAADELALFGKGERIVVFGKWTVEEFTKDGKKQFFNKLAIEHVRGSDHRRGARPQQQGQEPVKGAQARDLPSGNPGADFDDEIPF